MSEQDNVIVWNELPISSYCKTKCLQVMSIEDLNRSVKNSFLIESSGRQTYISFIKCCILLSIPRQHIERIIDYELEVEMFSVLSCRMAVCQSAFILMLGVSDTWFYRHISEYISFISKMTEEHKLTKRYKRISNKFD